MVGAGDMMARPKNNQDTTLLEMALVGYEFQRQKIDDKIREIRASLGGQKPAAKSAPAAESGRVAKAGTKKRRTLSAEARKRIAAAQKRRWAEHRKNQAAQDKA
jgi:hypothetical protein